MKVIRNTIYYLILAALLTVGLLLFATLTPLAGGVEAKIVKSGSMEPAIHVGSVVIIKPAASYALGDIITFGEDTKTQIPTTHRIVEVLPNGFSTKGDANDVPDPTVVRWEEVHGKVVISLPYLGYVLDFGRKPWGFVILVGIPALSIILEEAWKILGEIRKIKKTKREKLGGGAEGGRGKTFLALISVATLTWGVGNIGGTVSYSSDRELSRNNFLSASGDFSIPMQIQSFSAEETSSDSEPKILGTSTESDVIETVESEPAEIQTEVVEILEPESKESPEEVVETLEIEPVASPETATIPPPAPEPEAIPTEVP